MKQNYSLKTVLLLAACAFILFSCSRVSKSGKKTRNIVCVVDFSSSANSRERQEFYLNVIKTNVIKQLSPTDRIIVLPIDKASTTNSAEIYIENLSTRDFSPENASPMEEDQLTQKNFTTYKDSMEIAFENNFRKCISDRQIEGTDLFGALNNIKGYIVPTDDNYILFLSDMMNYTKELNMEPSNTQFVQTAFESILKKVPGISMQNTTALVLTGKQDGVTQEHFELVKSFWEKYFERNGIKLYSYSSATVSKVDELMALPLD